MAKEKTIAEIKDGAVYILQADTPVYVKTAEICAITGKSNQWIGELCKQGKIFKRKTLHGELYELNETMRNYCVMLEDRAKDHNDQSKEQNLIKLKADADMRKAKAAIAQVQVNELLGKVHRSEDVAAMTEDLVYTIRNALMALPGRLAVDVANASTAPEVSDIIRKEVFHVLEELSEYKYDPAKYEERARERFNMDPTESMMRDDE